ncbi:MAG: acyl-CoA dehydrogenase family protein [Pseudomonadota bacterium]
MNFEMSDDRRMLSDTLRRALAERYEFEHRTQVAYAPPYHDPDAWQALADLGVLFAFATEEDGGLGGSGFDIAVVFEEIGRALCPEPVLPALLAVRVLADAGRDVASVLSGSVRYALALGEIDAAYDLDVITTEARGAALTGRKSVVYGAGTAERLIVLARDETGLALYDVAAEDVEVISYGMIDGGPAGEVILDATPGTRLGIDAPKALADIEDLAALALSAEALGAIDRACEYLVDYLGTRTQFGQPIGAFQALQHRAVDLTIEVEQARSIVIAAAAALVGPDQRKRCAQAKHLTGRIAQLVAEEVIQMHGGIAMTWDYPVSHYAKRLVMIDHQFGDTDHHTERLIAMLQEEVSGTADQSVEEA